MMFRTILLVSLLAGPAWAVPQLYDVTGVAKGDVLNLREGPLASAAAIGQLPPDAKAVEGVQTVNGWVLVIVGEQSGWARQTFLKQHPDLWADGARPALHCYGTEPFWSLDLAGSGQKGGMQFQVEDKITTFPHPDIRQSRNRLYDYRFAGGGVEASLSEAACSDGMSDRTMGLSVMVNTPDALFSGCCMIAEGQ